MAPSGEYAESRPFKIFISLLDKWEIGAPLTETLVFDSFKAIKHLIESADGAEDVPSSPLPRLFFSLIFTSVGKDDGEHPLRSRGTSCSLEAITQCCV